MKKRVFLSMPAVVVLLLLCTSAAAEPPDPNVPNPPLQVLEHNVDGNGWIAVHEQGTANVYVEDGQIDAYVTGGQIDANITGGEVEINNTPSNPVPVNVENIFDEQDVVVNSGRLSSVTQVFAQTFYFGPTGTIDANFGRTIDATTITVSAHAGDEDIAINPEFILRFYSPLVPTTQPVLVINDTDADFRFVSQSFTYPVPLESLSIECWNEHKNCWLDISVFGFLGD